MMLSLACVSIESVGPASVEMLVDHVRIDVLVWAWAGMVEMIGIRQVMWLVMLESTKDQILGVDTPGQHVPPRV
jgi:hypothetical protein